MNFFVFPSKLRVKSHATALEFLNCLYLGHDININDIDDERYYFSFAKTKDGELLYGYGRYDSTGRLADPVLMLSVGQYKNMNAEAGHKGRDDLTAIDVAYLARKSINAFLTREWWH